MNPAAALGQKTIAAPRRYRQENLGKNCSSTGIRRKLFAARGHREHAKKYLAPFMIHEAFPTRTEAAFGSHPRCVVSVTYARSHCFHGEPQQSALARYCAPDPFTIPTEKVVRLSSDAN